MSSKKKNATNKSKTIKARGSKATITPKRTRQRFKVIKRNVIGETPAQVLADPRMGKNGSAASLTLANVQEGLPIFSSLDTANLRAFGMGFLSRALEKGWMTNVPNSSYPYYAHRFLYDMMVTFANSGTVPVTQLPLIILRYCRLLTPKTVNFAQGQISYTMAVGADHLPIPEIPIGYTAYGYQWTSAGPPAVPDKVDEFPVTDTGGPTYTPTLGQQAFALMCTFLQDQFGGDFRQVPVDTPTDWDKDVSAYAVPSQFQGLGPNGFSSGGVGMIAGLEVFSARPQLMTLNPTAQSSPPSTEFRYPVIVQNVAGDAILHGGLVGSTIPVQALTSRRTPKFHFIDFMEFLEVVALWVQQMQSNYYNDQGGTFSQNSPNITCPLSLQEVGFLLRNALMEAFQDTQKGVQALYPFVPSSGTDNQFVPFLAGSNTCFLQSVPFSLPCVLIENIRALIYRTTHRTDKSIEYFIPVLGQYSQDVLNSSDFTFKEGETIQPSFTIPTFFKGEKKVERRKSVDVPVVEFTKIPEIPISYVDGNSSNGFVCINNPTRLTTLAAAWEKWLTDNGLTSYSIKCDNFSKEPGINVLYSGNMTRYWAPEIVNTNPLYKKDDRFEVLLGKTVTAGPYSTRQAFATSAQSIPLSIPYSSFQSVWILPILQQEENDTLAQSSTVQRWQAMMSEPYLINSSSGFDGQTLSEMHSKYASRLTKARQTATDGWSSQLAVEEAKGRGGWLSALVGGAVTGLFPGAGPIVTAVSDALPF